MVPLAFKAVANSNHYEVFQPRQGTVNKHEYGAPRFKHLCVRSFYHFPNKFLNTLIAMPHNETRLEGL